MLFPAKGGLGFLTLAGLLAALPSFPQRFHFQEFGSEHGIVNLAARAVLRDRSGFLWIGTRSNVHRFDGVGFQLYRLRGGAPTETVEALHQSADGTIWMTTAGGLAVVEGDHLESVPGGRSLRTGGFHALASDKAGNLFVASTAGLFRTEAPGAGKQSTFRRVELPVEMMGEPVSSVYVDPAGTVWFGGTAKLCRSREGTLRCYLVEADEGGQGVSGIVSGSDGVVWVRADRRLYRYDDGRDALVRAAPILPQASRCRGLFVDPQNRLLAPAQNGLHRWDGTSWQVFSQLNGLPSEQICSVAFDSLGTPWLGMENQGIAHWRGYTAWEAFTRQEGLSSNMVTSVLLDAEDRFWVGTRFGLNLRRRDSSWRAWTAADGLASDEVRVMVADNSGGLWLGSSLGTGGLTRLDRATGKAERFGPAEGLQNVQVITMTLENPHRLWISVRKGRNRVFTVDPSVRPFRFVPYPPPKPNLSSVYRIVRASDGSLFLATTGGLYRQDERGWTYYGRKDGLRHEELIFLSERKPGELWLGYGKPYGLTRLTMQGSRIVGVAHFSEPDPLRSNDLSFVESDPKGRLWTGTENGIDIYDDSGWTHLSRSDGLIWTDCVLGAFFAAPDGSYYFGTTRGLAHMKKEGLVGRLPPPDVAITAVVSGGRSVSTSALPGTLDRSVEIHFTATDIGRSQDARYRYRLAPGDSGWQETRGRSLTFTNLGEGSYTFDIAATDGRSSSYGTPARLSFSVPAPWWRAAWFHASLLLLLGACMFMAWRWREKKLRSQHRLLEEMVRLRTHEIAEEKYTVEKQKQEIEDLLEKSEAASRIKGEFLATMSHEIRTPMNGVLGMTGLMLDTPLSSEQRAYAETIQNSAEALMTVINDILDFSKIERGKLLLEHIPFNLQAAVEDVAELLGPKAREKGLELIVWYSPELPQKVAGDPGRIRQALLNLLGNAIKFTQQGHVLLEASPAGGHNIRFVVQDTGIGIPGEKHTLIFDRFTQADSSTSRKYGGTGLGLAITKRLVEAMGGTIELSSEAGKGSTFTFTLPLPAECSQDAAPPAEILRDAKVLVLDDHAVSLAVTAQLCLRWRMEVHECTSGTKALAALAEADSAGVAFDVLLLDYLMPEMDGEQVAAGMLQLELRRPPAVILLTSAAVPGIQPRIERLGFAGCLSKPVRPQVLQRAVAAALWARSNPGPDAVLPEWAICPQPPKPQREAVPPFGGLRVILAEDNQVNQRVARRMLEKLGCQVDVATDGRQVIEMWKRTRYDMIFMDCQMPDIDGFEAAAAIRSLEPAGTHTPIIALTAAALPEDRDRCARVGMDGHLAKPFQPEALEAALETWSNGRPADADQAPR
jgi:signal transduction histidine kinase/CheY-like chemotaxis protein/ligand-binding sensor domain-containing protein